jgi:hypothetical protein
MAGIPYSPKQKGPNLTKMWPNKKTTKKHIVRFFYLFYFVLNFF